MNTTLNGTHTHRTTILKSILAATLLFCSLSPARSQSTENNFEHFGHTYNIGLGPGYFGASLMRSPYFTFNYEFEVLRNVTVAPFVGFATYRSAQQLYGTRYYYYRGTIVPVGAKASYYFDDVIELPYRWDLYAAGSIGYTFRNKRWESGYGGAKGELAGISPLYLDLHIGAEYQISDVTGIFVDLSTKMSVVGVGLHM